MDRSGKTGDAMAEMPYNWWRKDAVCRNGGRSSLEELRESHPKDGVREWEGFTATHRVDALKPCMRIVSLWRCLMLRVVSIGEKSAS